MDEDTSVAGRTSLIRRIIIIIIGTFIFHLVYAPKREGKIIIFEKFWAESSFCWVLFVKLLDFSLLEWSGAEEVMKCCFGKVVTQEE